MRTLAVVGAGMFGLGAMMQGNGYYDLGEAVKPVEDLAGQAGKAADSVVGAIGRGAEMPAWLIAFGLSVLALRFLMQSPMADKFIQGRNDRRAHTEMMELRKLEHQQALEKLHAENERQR